MPARFRTAARLSGRLPSPACERPPGPCPGPWPCPRPRDSSAAPRTPAQEEADKCQLHVQQATRPESARAGLARGPEARTRVRELAVERALHGSQRRARASAASRPWGADTGAPGPSGLWPSESRRARGSKIWRKLPSGRAEVRQGSARTQRRDRPAPRARERPGALARLTEATKGKGTETSVRGRGGRRGQLSPALGWPHRRRHRRCRLRPQTLRCHEPEGGGRSRESQSSGARRPRRLSHVLLR